MTDPVMLDTDIVIDYLRGFPAAATFVHGLASEPALSVLTVAELYRGVRDGPERTALDQFVAGTKALDLDTATATAGGLLLRTYAKSHGVGLADALIAATAQRHALSLVTLNRKHFPMLADVVTPYSRP